MGGVRDASDRDDLADELRRVKESAHERVPATPATLPPPLAPREPSAMPAMPAEPAPTASAYPSNGLAAGAACTPPVANTHASAMAAARRDGAPVRERGTKKSIRGYLAGTR